MNKKHVQYASKYARLSEATTGAKLSSADETDLVILPPDYGQQSEEEQIGENNDTLAAVKTGQIKVHEYNNISNEDV